MIRINLLPKKKKFKLKGGYLEFILFILVVVAVVLYIVNLNAKLKQQQLVIKNEIKKMERELRKLRKVEREVKALKKKKAELQQKIDVVLKLKESQKGYYKILTELEKALPQDVWVKNFNFKNNHVVLDVSALRSASVNEFIINMYKTGLFNDVELKVVKKTQVEGIDINNFTVSAKVNLGG